MIGKATMRSPTGFSSPAYSEHTVDVIAFTYGSHEDAKGYGRRGECTLAVVRRKSGHLLAVPVDWLEIPDDWLWVR